MQLLGTVTDVLHLVGGMLHTTELHILQTTNMQLRNTFARCMKHRRFVAVFTEFLLVTRLLKRTRHARLCFISPGYDVVIQLTVNSVHIPGGYREATYIPKKDGKLLSNTLGSSMRRVHGLPGKRLWNLLLSGWTLDIDGTYDKAHRGLTTYR
jgi:hypothetical protein